MPRTKNVVASRARRKKIRKEARGFYGARSRQIRTARDAVRRARAYSFAHRRKRPGDFRRLWIIRINAAARMYGMSYSKFMHALKVNNIDLDRKVLADMAVNDPNAFKALAQQVGAIQ